MQLKINQKIPNLLIYFRKMIQKHRIKAQSTIVYVQKQINYIFYCTETKFFSTFNKKHIYHAAKC